MPVVTMPDGANVSFPDDMPPAQIKGMILQKFPDVGSQQPNAMSANAASAGGSDPGQWVTGNILPIARNTATGEVSLAIPQILQDALSAPHNAATGKMPMQAADPVTGEVHTSPEAMAGGQAMASVIMPDAAAIPGGFRPRDVVAPEAATPTTAATPQSPVATGQSIGVQFPSAVVGGQVAKGLGRMVQDVPMMGGPLKDATAATNEQIGQAFKSAQSQYGTPDPNIAGANVQSSVGTYIRGVSQDSVTSKYNTVDSFIDPTIQSPLTQTQRIADNISAERTNSALPPSSAVDYLQNALSRPDGMNYYGIKGLRTGFSNMLTNKNIPVDWDEAEVNRLRDGLTTDLKNNINLSGGQQAVDAFDAATNYAAGVKARNQNLAKILGTRNNPLSPEAMVQKLYTAAGTSGTANGRLLVQARDAAGPDAWGDLAAAVLEKGGAVQNGGISQLDQNKFLNFWQGGISPLGKNILFNSFDRGGVTKSLDSIASSIQTMKDYNSLANTSKTAATSAVLGFGRTMAGAAVGTIAAHEPFTSISALIGGRVLAHILAQPATAKATSDWVKAYSMSARYGTMGSKTQLMNASRILATSIAGNLNVPKVIPSLTMKIQGITPSQAQQQDQQ